MRTKLWVVSFSLLLLGSQAVQARVVEDLSGPRDIQRGVFAVVESHFSIISDVADFSLLSGTFGYSLRGGYRFGMLGVFGLFEHNMWLAAEHGTDVVNGALNIGVGVELTYAGGFIHSSLALGPSILAFDTVLDNAGELGIFLDFRPVGLRWKIAEHMVLGLDPIAFAFVAPVLKGIPLVQTQYRTNLYLEYLF